MAFKRSQITLILFIVLVYTRCPIASAYLQEESEDTRTSRMFSTQADDSESRSLLALHIDQRPQRALEETPDEGGALLAGRQNINRGIDTWFDAHIFRKDKEHWCQQKLSKASSGLFAVSGSAVYVYLSYKFGDKTIHGRIPTGVVLSVLSAASPVLGYYKLNLPYYEHLLVTQDGRRKIVDKTKGLADTSIEAIMFVSNFLSAIPIAYASHKSFYPMIGPIPTWILDVPTLASIYLVYDITERELIRSIKGFYYSATLSEIRETSTFNVKEVRRRLFVHLRKLMAEPEKLSDERVNQIYDEVHQEREENPAIAPIGLDPRILALLSFLSFEDTQRKEGCGFSINPEDILGYLGGAIGLVGTYYFYDMGVQSVAEMCASAHISSHICHGLATASGAAIFGCRGVFSFVTTKATFQNMYGYVKNLCGCGKENNLTLVQKILVPASLTLFASVRSIPNVQMSFDYLGKKKWYDLLLGSCTALTTFAGSFWSLKAFSDGYFKTPSQTRRAILKEEINGVLHILPYLKDEALVEILRALRTPEGALGIPEEE